MSKKSSFWLILTVAFLITGNLVGAGILGLPINTGIAGLIPSLVAMLIVGGAMYFTAVILGREAIEIHNVSFNYPSLYKSYLGFAGKWVAIVANLIILYGLLTAYLTGATAVIAHLFHLKVSESVILLIFFICITALTVIDIAVMRKYNVLLMLVLFVSFAVIVFMGEEHIEVRRFIHEDWAFLPLSIPVIVTSFHFHNIIPSICNELKWNMASAWKTMLCAVIIGYAMNALWVQVGIGAIPLEGGGYSLISAFEQNLPATVPLAGEIRSPLFTICALLFALMAIATSYLTNGLSTVAFINDLTKNHLGISKRFLTMVLAFGPPLAISIAYPGIFLKALDITGGIGIVTLFGILPSIIGIIKAGSFGRRVFAVLMLLLFSSFLCFQLASQFGLLKPVVK